MSIAPPLEVLCAAGLAQIVLALTRWPGKTEKVSLLKCAPKAAEQSQLTWKPRFHRFGVAIYLMMLARWLHGDGVNVAAWK